MASVQEKLQLKRDPLDKWSLREQLCLASAVSRSGDQNWMSVSRALKPFGETNRPADWFHQKNCAAQYGALLANVDTPKRKKRSGVESVLETPAEFILRKLLADRQKELNQLLAEEKAEYRKLQGDMRLLQTGRVSEEQLDRWCKEIDEEESKREQEALDHVKWLKQRELRKQEIERAWKPLKPSFAVIGQKRKIPDIVDDFIDNEREVNVRLHQPESSPQYQQYLTLPQQQCQQKPAQYSHQVMSPHEIQHQPQQQQIQFHPQESVKPALSPLLTSLLKSPSQVQNQPSVSSSILHNAIANQNNNKQVEVAISSSPTITSLLSAPRTAPGSTLQEFSTSTINQQIDDIPIDDSNHPLDADLLDDANIKIDDLAKSMLVQDGPFPEIKKEEVDDIISEIIESAHDIVADPDQHLELDGNGEININLELDEFEQEAEMKEEEPKQENIDEAELSGKSSLNTPVIDPFEFQEDPVLFQSPVKPSAMKQDPIQHIPLYQPSPTKSEEISKKETYTAEESHINTPINDGNDVDENEISRNVHGSVEIVEVVAEEQENEKELNKAQIRDIVHSNKEKESKEIEGPELLPELNVTEINKDETETVSNDLLETKEPSSASDYLEPKEGDPCSNIDFALLTSQSEATTQNEATSDYPDDLYDNINMEVKIDKTGKAKRDYSRTKKKEEKSFDMLLAIEKAHLDDLNMSDDLVEYKVDNQKKEINARLKADHDRSSSPWTEEEDGNVKASKRRYSTSVTPVDSFPNSPASSIVYYDDDRDHRNWKKSVMLVYNRLSSNKYASLFLKPITDEQAPGYSTVIYRPMDLQTIKKNIDNGIIRTSLEFKRDVMLMFTNAIMYNKTNDTVYNMALQMQQESIDPIEILLQAEGQVDAPIRRETRTSESNCKRKRISEEPLKNKKKKDE